MLFRSVKCRLRGLKAQALETPQAALYYGLMLAASSETNKAAKYLGIAERGDLLPEEQALLAEAVKGL